jgi:hypothetical protein
MANINVGQVRSQIHSMPAAQHVIIQAGVLKALLDQIKGDHGGADQMIAAITIPSPLAPINLTGA